MTYSRRYYINFKKSLPYLAILMFLGVFVYHYSCNKQYQQLEPLKIKLEQSTEMELLEINTMEATRVRLMKRQKYFLGKCAETGLDRPGNDSLHRPNAWEYFANRKYHIIWCNVFKAASTSWIFNFNRLAGYSAEYLNKLTAVPVAFARKIYPRLTVEQLMEYLNDSMSFLIVRHPFERLVSAYRDKFEHSRTYTLFVPMAREIIRKYRPRDVRGPRYPLFEEFVNWILCEWKSGRELDMHWTPITNFCTPCQVHFDIIAKFETLEEDQNYIIKRAHLQDIIQSEWKNPTRGEHTKDIMRNYFIQLTRNDIVQLYEMFRYDFELFDYYPDEYFALGRNESSTFQCK